jgi:hypothetical protein
MQGQTALDNAKNKKEPNKQLNSSHMKMPPSPYVRSKQMSAKPSNMGTSAINFYYANLESKNVHSFDI